MCITYIDFSPEFLEALLGDFVMALYHIVWLLGVEGIGDGAEDEDVKLDPLFPFFLFLVLLCLKVEPLSRLNKLQHPILSYRHISKEFN